MPHNPTKLGFSRPHGARNPPRPVTGERRASNLYGVSSVSKFASERAKKWKRRRSRFGQSFLTPTKAYIDRSTLPREVTKHGELHRSQLRELRPSGREVWNDGFVGASNRPFSKLINTHGEYIEPLKYYDSGVIRYRRFPLYPHGAKNIASNNSEVNEYFPKSPRKPLGASKDGIVRADVPGKRWSRDLVELREKKEIRCPALREAAGLSAVEKQIYGTGRNWIEYRKKKNLKTPFRRTRESVNGTIHSRKSKLQEKRRLNEAIKTVQRISARANNQHAFSAKRTRFGVARMKHLSHCTVLRTTDAVGVDVRPSANIPKEFEDGDIMCKRQSRESWVAVQRLLDLVRKGGKNRSIESLLRFVDHWSKLRHEARIRRIAQKIAKEEKKKSKEWEKVKEKYKAEGKLRSLAELERRRKEEQDEKAESMERERKRREMEDGIIRPQAFGETVGRTVGGTDQTKKMLRRWMNPESVLGEVQKELIQNDPDYDRHQLTRTDFREMFAEKVAFHKLKETEKIFSALDPEYIDQIDARNLRMMLLLTHLLGPAPDGTTSRSPETIKRPRETIRRLFRELGWKATISKLEGPPPREISAYETLLIFNVVAPTYIARSRVMQMVEAGLRELGTGGMIRRLNESGINSIMKQEILIKTFGLFMKEHVLAAIEDASVTYNGRKGNRGKDTKTEKKNTYVGKLNRSAYMGGEGTTLIF
eukprot:g2915.t1